MTSCGPCKAQVRRAGESHTERGDLHQTGEVERDRGRDRARVCVWHNDGAPKLGARAGFYGRHSKNASVARLVAARINVGVHQVRHATRCHCEMVGPYRVACAFLRTFVHVVRAYASLYGNCALRMAAPHPRMWYATYQKLQ